MARVPRPEKSVHRVWCMQCPLQKVGCACWADIDPTKKSYFDVELQSFTVRECKASSAMYIQMEVGMFSIGYEISPSRATESSAAPGKKTG
eukprot:scaffold575_cov186-Amphora_coffeaeformis.AAC.3